MKLVCPELHSRYNELRYIGFGDDLSLYGEHYTPYVVLSVDYKSEKLKQDVVKGKKIKLQGELFEALQPEKIINGIRVV
jgi:hypothetical protein